jgi:hypothetical protein
MVALEVIETGPGDTVLVPAAAGLGRQRRSVAPTLCLMAARRWSRSPTTTGS